MEFPPDVWTQIFSYFHSSYKLPLHYTAIMKLESFKKRVKILKQLRARLYFESSKHCIFDSYYISILLKQMFYNTVNEDVRRVLLKPDILLNISKTNLKVKKDFMEIIDVYQKNSFWNPNGTMNMFEHILLIRNIL